LKGNCLTFRKKFFATFLEACKDPGGLTVLWEAD
jgi:hypothetical protein